MHLGHQPTGGNGNIPLTDMQSVPVRQETDKLYGIFIIVHRLAHPHDNHIGHPLTGQSGNSINLFQHLGGKQSPFQSVQRRGTEHTAHTASYLRRNADTVPMLIFHPHTLHRLPVRQFK